MALADLTGVRAKIAQAKKQLNALSEEATAYLGCRPYRLVSKENAGVHSLIAKIDRVPPSVNWSVELGQIAYNIRSGLDQLVFQLAIDNGSNPANDRTQFPIFSNHDEYFGKRPGRESKRDAMLKGVAKKHRRLIDGVQPYNRGRRVENDPFAILGTLSNRDKHREPHAFLGTFRSYTIVGISGEQEVIRMKFEPHAPNVVRDGDVLFEFSGITIEIVSSGETTNEVEFQEADGSVLDVVFETDHAMVFTLAHRLHALRPPTPPPAPLQDL